MITLILELVPGTCSLGDLMFIQLKLRPSNNMVYMHAAGISLTFLAGASWFMQVGKTFSSGLLYQKKLPQMVKPGEQNHPHSHEMYPVPCP